MMKLILLAAASLALLIPQSASAQNLDRSAAAARATLASLVGVVEDRIPRDKGRNDIKNGIENTRADLDTIRDLAGRGASRGQIAGYMQKSRDDFNEMIRRFGDHADRDSIRPLIDVARNDMTRLERAWAIYASVVVDRRPGFNPPQTVVVSRTDWARGLAINHLAGFFHVSPTTIESTAVEKSGSRYKVWAHSRKIGSYIVDLDAVTGRVYSATPVGPR